MKKLLLLFAILVIGCSKDVIETHSISYVLEGTATNVEISFTVKTGNETERFTEPFATLPYVFSRDGVDDRMKLWVNCAHPQLDNFTAVKLIVDGVVVESKTDFSDVPNSTTGANFSLSYLGQ